MATAKQPTRHSIYQLKITLKGVKPPVWRRVQVSGQISLNRLHRVIQIVMGWEDAHLHSFTIGMMHYGEPDPGWDMGMDEQDDREVKLERVVTEAKSRFLYIYDFGDGWEHDILVEQILPPEADVKYPLCLGGKRACPPEDCGGVWGYMEMLEIIRDPAHDEHASLTDWLGDDFDPEAFDPERVNTRLRRARR